MADIGLRVVILGTAEARRNLGAVQSDLSNLSRTIGQLSGSSSTLGQTLSRVGGALIGVGRTLTIAVTAPIAAMGTAAITAGINFEDAFAGIGKTVEGVMDNMGNLTKIGQEVRDEFRQMALEIPVATEELAHLGEVVGQLGVGAEDVAEVTRLVAMLGATTELTAEDAAKGLIQFKNILLGAGGDIEDFIKRAGSALVALGNTSVSTEGDILNLTLRLAAAGDKAKMTAPEIMAWATTLADLGVRAESGGTAVSRAITEMVFAIQSGSDNLGTFAKVTGQSVDQFVKAFEVDASGALLNFISKLEAGIRAGTVTKEMLADLGLSGVRAIDVLGRLGDATDIFTKNLDTANREWERALALEEEFNKRAATVKSMLQILKNQFTDLGITIFDLVKDDLVNLIKGIGELVDKFKNLDPATQKTIINLALMAAAIGPVLIVVGGLIAGLGAVVTGITALLSPVGLASAAIAGLAAVLGALIVPDILAGLEDIKSMALDIAELLGFIEITPTQATPRDQEEEGAPSPEIKFKLPSFDEFLAGLKELGGPDVERALESLDRIGDSFSRIISRLADSPVVKKALDDIAASIGNIGKTLKDMSLRGLEGLADWMEDNEDELVTIGENLATFAANMADTADVLLRMADPAISGAIEILGVVLAGLVDILAQDWEGAGENFSKLPDMVRETAFETGQAVNEGWQESKVADIWKGNFDQLVTIATFSLAPLSTQVGIALSPLHAIISDIFTGAYNIILGKTGEGEGAANAWGSAVLNGVSQGTSGIASIVASTMALAVTQVVVSAGPALAAGVTWVTAVASGITSGVGKVINSATSAIQGAVDAAMIAAAGAAAIGSAMIAGIVGAIEGGASAVIDAMVDAVMAAIEAAMAAAGISSPSKVTAEMGQNMIKGLVVGLEDDDESRKAATSATSGILSAMEALLGVGMPRTVTNNNASETNINFGDITGVPLNSQQDLIDLLSERLLLAGA